MARNSKRGVDLLALAREVDPSQRDYGLKPVQEEDHVVGVVSEELRRIWLVYTDLRTHARNEIENVAALDHAHSNLHGKRECNRRGCARLRDHIETAKVRALEAEAALTHVSCAFWALACLELSILEMPEQELALRKGFVVVTTDEVDEDHNREVGEWLSGLSSS